jgi:hypothetical protein
MLVIELQPWIPVSCGMWQLGMYEAWMLGVGLDPEIHVVQVFCLETREGIGRGFWMREMFADWG